LVAAAAWGIRTGMENKITVAQGKVHLVMELVVAAVEMIAATTTAVGLAGLLVL
jgi:hypothetical protein